MKHRSITSTLIVLVAIVVIGFIAMATFRETKRSQEIDKEIALLEQEASRINRDNHLLEERIAYFETDAFQERLAKEKLNLQREGEHVVVVTPQPQKEDAPTAVVAGAEIEAPFATPFYVKWWRIFFHK